MNASQPRSPDHRPGWLVLLTMLMLVGAARLGLGAAAWLMDRAAESAVDGSLAVTPQEVLVRALEQATLAAQAAFPVVMKGHAFVRIGLALLTLYAVAAIFSLDPAGRRLALWSGWAAMAFHLGDAAVWVVALRRGILDASPAILDALTRVSADAGAPPPSRADMMASLALATWLLPVLSALAGMAFATAVLVCFGGRRGRVLYGLVQAEGHGS